MSNKRKYILFYALGMVCSVIPPVIATLCYFPLFIAQSTRAVVSGIAVLLLIIATIPIARFIRNHWRMEAMPLLWGAFLLIFYAASKIIDQVINIAFVGTIANIVAFAVIIVAKKYKSKWEDEKKGN